MLISSSPFNGAGKSICLEFVTDEDAILISRSVAAMRPKGNYPPYTDEMALADFQTVHWAETIEQTIEKMAKEIQTVCGNDMMTAKLQARAALKALGVPGIVYVS